MFSPIFPSNISPQQTAEILRWKSARQVMVKRADAMMTIVQLLALKLCFPEWFTSDPYFCEEKPKAVVLKPSVHEQAEGTILGMCITGTKSENSLRAWITFLQGTIPKLADLPVVFSLFNQEEGLQAYQDQQTKQDDRKAYWNGETLQDICMHTEQRYRNDRLWTARVVEWYQAGVFCRNIWSTFERFCSWNFSHTLLVGSNWCSRNKLFLFWKQSFFSHDLFYLFIYFCISNVIEWRSQM